MATPNMLSLNFSRKVNPLNTKISCCGIRSWSHIFLDSIHHFPHFLVAVFKALTQLCYLVLYYYICIIWLNLVLWCYNLLKLILLNPWFSKPCCCEGRSSRPPARPRCGQLCQLCRRPPTPWGQLCQPRCQRRRCSHRRPCWSQVCL